MFCLFVLLCVYGVLLLVWYGVLFGWFGVIFFYIAFFLVIPGPNRYLLDLLTIHSSLTGLRPRQFSATQSIQKCSLNLTLFLQQLPDLKRKGTRCLSVYRNHINF